VAACRILDGDVEMTRRGRHDVNGDGLVGCGVSLERDDSLIFVSAETT
jgi:hypothetical protein